LIKYEERSMMLRMIVSAALAAALTVVGAGAEAESHVSLNAKPTPAQTAAVKRAFGADFADMTPFLVGQAHLSGDRHGDRPDLIIWTQNRLYCGSGGCGVSALLATANGYAAKGIDLGILSQGGDVVVLDAVHHGMHDLRFDSASHVFRWNGKQYQ
jgi:hypothetical protein